MNYFVITTNKEVATQIEKFFQSGILSHNRTIELGKVSHNDGFSDVQIIAAKEDEKMNPEDIFWLGHYCASL